MDTRFSKPSANAHEKQVYVTNSDENIDATIHGMVISLRHYALPQMRVA